MNDVLEAGRAGIACEKPRRNTRLMSWPVFVMAQGIEIGSGLVCCCAASVLVSQSSPGRL